MRGYRPNGKSPRVNQAFINKLGHDWSFLLGEAGGVKRTTVLED